MFQTYEERKEAGKSQRKQVTRESHQQWEHPHQRHEPINILEESNRGRLPELIPIRYGRMSKSPFAFLRGSAALMAYDLSVTPNTGIQLQACGDCHLLNFGLFASVERNLIFDINDFDETHPAPWEWDIKRLATSFVVACREYNISDADAKDAALSCVRHYREHLQTFAHMSPLELWYYRIDAKTLIDLAPDEKSRAVRKELAAQARKRIVGRLFPKITYEVNGEYQFVDQPPLLFHVPEPDFEEKIKIGLKHYRDSLRDDYKVLFDHYRFVDVAMKVVGVGSVGTRCYVVLMVSDENYPLVLQFKEAKKSVLEPYTEKCRYDNQGKRIIAGQRLMQSSSDIFLGWTHDNNGYDFYGRQLRDMKYTIPIEEFSAIQMKRYAEVCGWALARAHAKAGNSAMIGGYLGKSNKFDQAIAKFALSYADQVEKDYHVLLEAIRKGKIEAVKEE